MRTKLYTLLTSLLMVACITSYGQDIVSQFSYSNGNTFNRCDLIEAADGTLLAVSYYYYDETYSNGVSIIYKFSFEGELIDSLSFPNSFYNALWATHPNDADQFVFASFIKEESNAFFQIVFIDANLNIIEEKQVSIPSFGENCFAHSVFLDTQGDIIASYWDNDTFHMVRIGLDGTLKEDREIEGLYPSAYSRPDTTLYYQDMGLSNTTPQQFSLVAAWDRGNYAPWPVVGYTFDDDFNLIDTHFYSWYNSQTAFAGGMLEHMVSFDEDSYLLASRMWYSNYGYAALIKYSRNHEPLKFQMFEGNDPYRYNVPPCDTKVMPDHTIYFAYMTHTTTGNHVELVCMNQDLDILWTCSIPEIPGKAFGNAKITVLNDGRTIALGTTVWYQSYTKAYLQIYIIKNSTTSVEEASTIAHPFTLHPNPVKDQLCLSFVKGTEAENIELYDLAGRLVVTKYSGLENIDMSALPAGVYMMHITMKDGTSYHEKILKE